MRKTCFDCGFSTELTADRFCPEDGRRLIPTKLELPDRTLRLVRRVHRSERADVLLARGVTGDNAFAVKLVRADDPAAFALKQEALAAAVTWPQSPGLFEVGADLLALLRPWVPGTTVADLMVAAPLSPDAARRIGAGLLDALALAHKRRLGHGAVTEAHVIVCGAQLGLIGARRPSAALSTACADVKAAMTIVARLLVGPYDDALTRAASRPLSPDLLNVLMACRTGRAPSAVQAARALRSTRPPKAGVSRQPSAVSRQRAGVGRRVSPPPPPMPVDENRVPLAGAFTLAALALAAGLCAGALGALAVNAFDPAAPLLIRPVARLVMPPPARRPPETEVKTDGRRQAALAEAPPAPPKRKVRRRGRRRGRP